MEEKDLFFMKEALGEAGKAFHIGEVPVGAVLVFQNQIIARAHNRVESVQDASMHAEMICLRRGNQFFNNWRLLGTTLYTTLEPCSMCAGALFLHRVERVVWGAPDLRHGADGSFVSLLEIQHPTHTLKITRGILKEEAAALMKKFFMQRREKVKRP